MDPISLNLFVVCRILQIVLGFHYAVADITIFPPWRHGRTVILAPDHVAQSMWSLTNLRDVGTRHIQLCARAREMSIA